MIGRTDGAGGPSVGIPLSVKLCYGMAEGANSILTMPVGLVLLYFLTDVAGIPPALAGTLIGLGMITDAFTDPLIGILSDKSRLRWGRRRPFMLIGAVPAAALLWLAFTDFRLPGSLSVWYFGVVVYLFYSALVVVEIPYCALAAEMTLDYDERTRLTSFQSFWNQAGILIGSVGPLLLVSLFKDTIGSERAAYSLMAAAHGLLAVLLILATWRATRGYERYPTQHYAVRPRQLLSDIWSNRAFVFTVCAVMPAVMAVEGLSSLLLFYLKSNLGFDEDQSALIFALCFGASLLWVPAINALTRKLGKPSAFVALVVLGAVNGLALLLVRPGSHDLIYLVAIFAGAPAAAFYLLAWSMTADAVEVDELRSGHRREGMYYSFNAFVYKFATGGGAWWNGLLLSFIGYKEGAAVQSAVTLERLHHLVALYVIPFYVVSVAAALLMPMTRQRHAALLEAIEKKKRNDPWDRGVLRHLTRGGSEANAEA